jgi:acyl-CoA thioester hydrolase
VWQGSGVPVTEDPRDLRRSDFPVLREVPTRWADVDAYGHVNNVVHYAVFDTAVNAWLIEATGEDVRRWPSLGLVVETSCRYLAELDFPAPITAGLAVERLGNSSIRYLLGLFGTAESPAAVGRFVHVYVDRATRRPVAVPDAVRAAVASLSGQR